MDDGDIYKERIAQLLRVIQYTKIIKEDSIPCKIDEGLYLGSLGAANNRSALKSLNITHVLTVANSLNPAHPTEFTYKLIQVSDREDVTISQYFDECFAFIEEARAFGGGVFVHCFAGRSRSVTIVIAYLMYKNSMSFSEALGHVKSKRPVASPNFGFISQLREYERSLQGRGKVLKANLLFAPSMQAKTGALTGIISGTGKSGTGPRVVSTVRRPGEKATLPLSNKRPREAATTLRDEDDNEMKSDNPYTGGKGGSSSDPPTEGSDAVLALTFSAMLSSSSTPPLEMWKSEIPISGTLDQPEVLAALLNYYGIPTERSKILDLDRKGMMRKVIHDHLQASASLKFAMERWNADLSTMEKLRGSLSKTETELIKSLDTSLEQSQHISKLESENRELKRKLAEAFKGQSDAEKKAAALEKDKAELEKKVALLSFQNEAREKEIGAKTVEDFKRSQELDHLVLYRQSFALYEMMETIAESLEEVEGLNLREFACYEAYFQWKDSNLSLEDFMSGAANQQPSIGAFDDSIDLDRSSFDVDD